MPRARALPVLILAAALALPGCRTRESPEAAQSRTLRAIYERQIAGLEELVARAERGEDVTGHASLAVGVHEEVIRTLLNASLPVETRVGDRLQVRLEKAEAYFRLTQAVVVFEGRLRATARPDAFLAVRLAGGLDKVQFGEGKLSARVKLFQAEVQGTSLGELAAGTLDGLLKNHLGDIQDAIPGFDIPVKLDQAIHVGGLGEGPVSVAPGSLPLKVEVDRLLPGSERLWVMLAVTAGPWTRDPVPPVPGPAGAEP